MGTQRDQGHAGGGGDGQKPEPAGTSLNHDSWSDSKKRRKRRHEDDDHEYQPHVKRIKQEKTTVERSHQKYKKKDKRNDKSGSRYSDGRHRSHQYPELDPAREKHNSGEMITALYLLSSYYNAEEGRFIPSNVHRYAERLMHDCSRELHRAKDDEIEEMKTIYDHYHAQFKADGVMTFACSIAQYSRDIFHSNGNSCHGHSKRVK